MKWLFFICAIIAGLSATFIVDNNDNKLIMMGISTLIYGVFFILDEIDDLKDK